MFASTRLQTQVRVAFHWLLTFASLAIVFGIVSKTSGVPGRDLPQDYAAARAFLDGDSAYQSRHDLNDRYGCFHEEPDVLVVYNPHPPVAILLTAPFAFTDFDHAVQLIVWTQLAILALTWALSYEMFKPQIPGWVWAIAGGAFGFWSPVWQGLAVWAQPLGLLALGTLGLWWLARTERPWAFGVLLAALILVRPFVAILAVLVCHWSLRQQCRVMAGGLIVGLTSFAVLQIWPWEWFHRASYAEGYVSACGSIPGVLGIGSRGGMICYGLAIAVLALLRRRGMSTDKTAAIAATSSMLVYPLAWPQYDTSLLPVIAWVLACLTARENRLAFWTLTVYLAIRTMPDLMPATENSEGFYGILRMYKNGIQLIARGFLLAAVIAVTPGGPGKRRSNLNANEQEECFTGEPVHVP